MAQEDLFSIWNEEEKAALEVKNLKLCWTHIKWWQNERYFKSGSISEIWKIPGEHKLIGVISVDSPGGLDSWVESSYEHLVHGISTVFTPVRPYEDFAANIGDWLKEDVNISPEYCPPKNGLHYFLTFTVEYEGMKQEELFKVWIDEAKAALEAKKSGTILDLWKVVAQRKVFAIVCVEKPGDLDQISFELPIMKTMGDKVHITCKSIRQAGDWIKDVQEKRRRADYKSHDFGFY